MKKYLVSFFLLVVTYGAIFLFYKAAEPFLPKELISILYKSFFTLVFLFIILKYTKKGLFSFRQLSVFQSLITLGLLSLFVLNNYFLSTFEEDLSFMKSSNLYLVVTSLIVNSFYEEFLYRGFIQRYINEGTTQLKTPLSRGNLFASFLMFLIHLGFFTVMTPLLAITSIGLVLIFSLTVGYIQDKNGSIWWAILIHTLANFIHLVINISHYLA